MRFKEYQEYQEYQKTQNEAFDNPYPIRNDMKGSYSQWSFVTDDDVFYLVTIDAGEETINGMEFSYVQINFENEQGKMSITNTGDAFRVFASVFAILKKESRKIQASDYITFASASSEPSRAKLYDRFARILKKQGYKYQEKIKQHSDWHYLLSKKDILDEIQVVYQ